MRIGHGWDLHRMVEGRPCLLGGVSVAHSKGPLGHSDGDVVLHAVTDALLGAAAMGDIGLLFPDTDPRWKGADSADMLTHVVERIRAGGFGISNVDVTIVAQEPKIGPHREAITRRLSALLDLPAGRLNLKAKTTEGLGDIGSGDAIACHAVALLWERGEGTS